MHYVDITVGLLLALARQPYLVHTGILDHAVTLMCRGGGGRGRRGGVCCGLMGKEGSQVEWVSVFSSVSEQEVRLAVPTQPWLLPLWVLTTDMYTLTQTIIHVLYIQ